MLGLRIAGAQQGGSVAGTIRDRSGSVLPGAEVKIQSEITGARQKVYSDAGGYYQSAALLAGTYKIVARNGGFRTLTQSDISVVEGKTTFADFVMDILPLQQEVTVKSGGDDRDPTSDGLTVSRESPTGTLPSNGRDVHAYFSLLPGAVVTPASTNDGGQFSIDGQRPNTNTFRIDGISGNTGIGITSLPGTFPGATLPGMTAIGSTQILASKEESQRVELKSTEFAPEFGDRPGAQVSIETRSGTNDFHASLLGYSRPGMLDNQDWFAQHYAPGTPPASLSGYGASFGGALVANKVFFFVASERVTVHDRATQLLAVPSAQARAGSSSAYRAILNIFPTSQIALPDPLEAMGSLGIRNDAVISNYSVRLDQKFSENAQSFIRYSSVPSNANATSQLNPSSANLKWWTATFGLNAQSANSTHEFRLNFSHAAVISSSGDDRLARNNLFNLLSDFYALGCSLCGITQITIAGAGQLVYGTSDGSFQNQWEGRYIAGCQAGRHDLRAGTDYIRLAPRRESANGAETTALTSPGLDSLVEGQPLAVTQSTGLAVGINVAVPIASVFAQDTFRVNGRLSLLYGLRWEVTPPVNTQFTPNFPYVGTWGGPGTKPSFLSQVTDVGLSRWPMRYGQFAPRMGMAYRLHSPGVVLRLGGASSTTRGSVR